MKKIDVSTLLFCLCFMTSCFAKDYYAQSTTDLTELYELETFYLAQSVALSKNGYGAAALDSCKYILKKYPNHPRVLQMLIQLTEKGIAPKPIETILKSTLRQFPEQAANHYWLGKFYEKTGHPSQALPFYQKAIQLAPQQK